MKEEIRLVFSCKGHNIGNLYIKIEPMGAMLQNGGTGYGCATLTNAMEKMKTDFPEAKFAYIETRLSKTNVFYIDKNLINT